MAIWRICIACWIPKATDTHSQYAILLAFPPQQRLHERASMLRYTHSTFPVLFGIVSLRMTYRRSPRVTRWTHRNCFLNIAAF